MWDEAAKWLNKFDEVVLTVLDTDGYPASVRADSHAYDPATGELPAAVPDALRVVEGPASLLCHCHDEKLWKLNAIQVKGRLENRDGAWVFVSTHSKRRPNWPVFLHQGDTDLGPEVSRQTRPRPSIGELDGCQGDSTSRQALEAASTPSYRLRGSPHIE